MAKRGRTEHIREILADLLAKRGYGRPLGQDAMRQAWGKAAGERLAARTRVATFRDGILTIEVDSAALRYELEAFRSAGLLAVLKQDRTIPEVRKIVFRVGSTAA